jgi:alkylated DNA repair dioxygenase AlkB
MDLHRTSSLPDGFDYAPDLLSPDEEAGLVGWFQTLELRPYEFRGYLARRRIASFGPRYDTEEAARHPEPGMVSQLLSLRDRVARRFGAEPAAFSHALVTEYPVGAGIGWHRDRTIFADVFGVSFLSACRFRLRRRAGSRWQRTSVVLAPRSAYALRGPARSVWEHSIPAAESVRYSVTFRSFGTALGPRGSP